MLFRSSWSGHWLYSFLRHDPASGQSFLVVANFHGTESLRGVKIHIPAEAWEFMNRTGQPIWKFTDRLDSDWSGESAADTLALPHLPACSAMILEIG